MPMSENIFESFLQNIINIIAKYTNNIIVIPVRVCYYAIPYFDIGLRLLSSIFGISNVIITHNKHIMFTSIKCMYITKQNLVLLSISLVITCVFVHKQHYSVHQLCLCLFLVYYKQC